MKKLTRFLTALLLTFTLFAHAEMVDTYAFKNQADRTRAVELAKSLRCPQCQNQNLVESNSPIAYDLRIEVYKMVDEGKTNQQIIDTMTARFGNFVNYKPPFQWNTALLWLLPILLLIGAFALILFSTKKSEGEPTQLENQPYTAPKEEKSAVKFETKSAIWVFAILLVLPLSYYFSLDRFERVQQGEKEMIELANKKADTSMVHQKEDMVLKIQNKIREDVNNPELWAQLGDAYMQNDEFDHALIAYSNAEKISGTTPAILGLKATALYYQAGQNITPQIQQIMDQALKQDKNEISVLTLLATETFKNHQPEQSKAYWQQLLDSGNAAVDRRTVIQRIKMIDYFEKGQTSQ